MTIEIKTPWGIGGKIINLIHWLITGEKLKKAPKGDKIVKSTHSRGR